MTKKKNPLKPAIIAFCSVAALLVIIFVGISSSNSFKETHNDAIPQTVGADGRYQAGSAEFTRIEISPALALELSDHTWMWVGGILLGLLGIFILLVSTNVVTFDGPAPSRISFALLGAILLCFFAAYSSAFANNDIELTPDQYNIVKGDKAKIEQLFRDKELVR
jgi:hypothetical protein